MTHVLIIAHAPLASALSAVARHAYPDCAAEVQAMDVADDANEEQVASAARALIAARADADTLVFTDVFGATPCRGAALLLANPRVRMVAGVNVPMLWRTLCYGGDTLEGVAERAYAGGRDGVMPVNLSRPQNQSIEITRHVASDHHHQQ